MLRRTVLAGIAAALTFLAQGQGLQAAPVNGTQGIVNDGPNVGTTANTGNINTATAFSFEALKTTASRTGDFLTTPGTVNQQLGAATLTINGSNAIGASGSATLTFGNPVYGTFTTATYTVLQSDANTQAFLLSGIFAPGTLFPNAMAGPATVIANFTQQNGQGAISASLTLSSSSGTVPEPASLAMLGLGLAGVAGFGRLRRKSA